MVEVDNSELERRAEIMMGYGGVQPIHNPFYSYSVRYSAERAMAAGQDHERFMSS